MIGKGHLAHQHCPPTHQVPIPKHGIPLPPPHLGKWKEKMTQGVREDQGFFRALRSLDEKYKGWGIVKKSAEASGAQEQITVHPTHPLPRLRFLIFRKWVQNRFALKHEHFKLA